MFSFSNRLLIFYLITAFGSSLSSVSTFLNIEKHFFSLNTLAIALAMRTLAVAISSYFTPLIINKIHLKNSILIAQLFGCCALVILFYGFYSNIYIFVILGIMLTGIAPNITAILLTVTLKIYSESATDYRSRSGVRELVLAIATFLAFIIAPPLLHITSFNTILKLDGISYLAAAAIIMCIKFPPLQSAKTIEHQSSRISFKKLFIKTNGVTNFIIQTSASLFLAGLTPLLASSNNIALSEHLPLLLRQSMWSIEAAASIVASIIYLRLKNGVLKYSSNSLLMTSGIFLFLPVFIPWKYMIIISAMLISLLLALSFMKYRDDLLVTADNNHGLINDYAAFSMLYKNFVYFLSPLILSYIFLHLNIATAAVFIVFVQSIFVITKNSTSSQLSSVKQE